MNFANPRVDLAFKKIFGNENHTEVLISFLNAILDFKNEQRIIELWLTNPYQTSNIRELKQTVINVKADEESDDIKKEFYPKLIDSIVHSPYNQNSNSVNDMIPSLIKFKKLCSHSKNSELRFQYVIKLDHLT